MRHIAIAAGLMAATTISLQAATAEAQTRSGPRAAMPPDVEVALARSAAPPAISDSARVWIWNGHRYAVAEQGKSPVNCYVGRPWVESLEPHCFDAEGSSSVMPILMKRVELYAAGKSEPEAEREIKLTIAKGGFRLPRRPAFTYMMSAAQHLVNGEGVAVGAWQPHLMIYYPGLTAAATGLRGFVHGVGFIENPGQPMSAYIIPLQTFVPKPAFRKSLPSPPSRWSSPPPPSR